MTNIEKLNKILMAEKEKHGSVKWHFSLKPDATGNAEEIAGELIDMYQALLDGKFKDITNEVM